MLSTFLKSVLVKANPIFWYVLFAILAYFLINTSWFGYFLINVDLISKWIWKLNDTKTTQILWF